MIILLQQETCDVVDSSIFYVHIQSPLFVSNCKTIKSRGPKFCCNFKQLTTVKKINDTSNPMRNASQNYKQIFITSLHQIWEFKIIQPYKVISCQSVVLA